MFYALVVVIYVIAALLALHMWYETKARRAWLSASFQHYREVKEGLARLENLLVPRPLPIDKGLIEAALSVGASPIGKEEQEAEEDIGVKVPDTLTYKA